MVVARRLARSLVAEQDPAAAGDGGQAEGQSDGGDGVQDKVLASFVHV
jgi:hypothetical protein